MGIIATGAGVHIAATTSQKKLCCHLSVNKSLNITRLPGDVSHYINTTFLEFLLV